MNIVGIRAKPHEVTFAVYNTSDNTIENVETIRLPKAMDTPDALKYVRNNILDVLREYEVRRAGIRITESNAQRMNIRRIEIEGVIQEAFASSHLEYYYCGQISNISRRIGIDRADFKPLVAGTKTFDKVESWGDLSSEEREAVLTAIGASNA